MKRTPLNRVSKKRRRDEPIRKQVREFVLDRDEGRCQAYLADICSHFASDVHEIQTRGRGGDYLDVNNCVALCRRCHSFITDNPKWAATNGWVVSAWATAADFVAAQRAREMRLWESEGDLI